MHTLVSPTPMVKTVMKRSKSISSHLGVFIRRERTVSETAGKRASSNLDDCSSFSPLSPGLLFHTGRESRSGGGLVFHRLAKRLSKINRKSGGERRGEGREAKDSAKNRLSRPDLSDTTDGGDIGEKKSKPKKLRHRSTSISNMENISRWAVSSQEPNVAHVTSTCSTHVPSCTLRSQLKCFVVVESIKVPLAVTCSIV